jgi:hypothetical protein
MRDLTMVIHMKKTLTILMEIASLTIAMLAVVILAIATVDALYTKKQAHVAQPKEQTPEDLGAIPVDKPVAIALEGLFPFPGLSLPGHLPAWEYDVQTGLIRYGWDYYFEGVEYEATFYRYGFAYTNIYLDHVDSWSHNDAIPEWVLPEFSHTPLWPHSRLCVDLLIDPKW